MSKKRVASIECEIPGGLSEYISIDSESSLLDHDIIIFRPSILSLVDYNEQYQGKPSLYDSSSFKLRERMEHWRRKLSMQSILAKQSFSSWKNLMKSI